MVACASHATLPVVAAGSTSRVTAIYKPYITPSYLWAYTVRQRYFYPLLTRSLFWSVLRQPPCGECDVRDDAIRMARLERFDLLQAVQVAWLPGAERWGDPIGVAHSSHVAVASTVVCSSPAVSGRGHRGWTRKVRPSTHCSCISPPHLLLTMAWPKNTYSNDSTTTCY